MALFDNQQAVNLRACEQMVESVLGQMGVDTQRSRLPDTEHGPAWGLLCGSAYVYIFLLRSGSSEENFIQVIAPVFKPADVSGSGALLLWRRLLEFNGRVLTGAAFALRDGEVVVSTDRSTKGLDRVEIEDMIRRIGDYADLYDDLLSREFGGLRHCDLPPK